MYQLKRSMSGLLAFVLAFALLLSPAGSLSAFADGVTPGMSDMAEGPAVGESELVPGESEPAPGQSEPTPGESEPVPGQSEPTIGESVPVIGGSGSEEAAPFALPKEFTLSTEQLDQKRAMSKNGTLTNFDTMIMGRDYVSREIIFMAETEEYALAVAKAFGGSLSSWRMSIAVVTLGENVTTQQAVAASADTKSNLPPVFPNMVYTAGPVDDGMEPNVEKSLNSSAAFAMDVVPTLPTWENRPNDPQLQNPNAGDTQVPYQWMHDAVGTLAAWGTTQGEGVVVAVLDTGVRVTHEDLAENVLPLINEVTGNLNNTDLDGHGTHVAGIIAAAADNSKGGAGIAPKAKILPVKVLGDNGQGYTSDITRGIGSAVDNGASIINMSLGGLYYDQFYESALQSAANKGVASIVAAGNEGSNHKAYPAGFPVTITVASTDSAGRRSNFSNWGTWVDVAAPGSRIWSTVCSSDSAYASYNGTSMATPVVSGVAALYLSEFSGTGARDINGDGQTNAKDVEALRAALKKNVEPAKSSQIGTGIVSVLKMFSMAPTLPVFTVRATTGETIADTKSAIPQGSTLEITATIGTVVYTTDGTTPVVTNGTVTNGKVYREPIVLSDAKITIKAFSVSPAGGVSKLVTVAYTTYPVNIPVTELEISGSSSVLAGKSVPYTATVSPSDATNKKVLWSIVSGGEKAAISSGKLTIKANQTGNITIRAVSASNPSVWADFTVTITPVAVSSISLSLASARLVVGINETVQLTPIFIDAKKVVIPTATVPHAFQSSNKAVATVNESGQITATGNGTAKITCSALDGSAKSASITVAVTVPVTGIENTGTTMVAAGKSVQLSAAVSPAGATNKKLTWSLVEGKELVTSFSASGLLKAKANVSGTIIVKATAADNFGATQELSIQVLDKAVTSLSLSKIKTTLFTEEMEGALYPTSEKLGVTISPENPVIWKSSNTKVATINTEGVVTAVAKGSAVVTASAIDGSGKSAKCTVTVASPVTGIEITTAQRSVVSLKTLQLAAKCSPASALNKVTWEIIDGSEFATITSAGKLAAKGGVTGAVTVQAVATDGSKTKQTAVINIYQNTVSGVTVVSDRGSILLTEKIVGSEYDTTLSLSPVFTANGYDFCQDVKWSSSSTKVAVVDSAGTVTAKAPGSVVITAAALDGSGKKGSISIKVIRPVTEISIKGNADIPVGRKLKYTATVTAAATNKGITWSVTPEDYATIAQDGTLLIKPGGSGTVKVTATAKDGSGVASEKTVTVRALPITLINLGSSSGNAIYKTTGQLVKLSLFTMSIPMSEYDKIKDTNEKVCQLTSYANYSNAPVTFSSSNTKVATVDSTGLVTAVGAGNATITCAAADGGTVKATVPVTVIVPTSYITVNSKTELTTYPEPTIARGTSRQFVATPGNTYGKPSVSTVTWDFLVMGGSPGYEIPNYSKTDAYKKNGYLKISSSGVLTASSKINEILRVAVKATSTDGSLTSASLISDIVPPTTYLSSYMSLPWPLKYNSGGGYVPVFSNSYYHDYTIVSSDPDILSFVDLDTNASYIENGKRYFFVGVAAPKKTGTATLTITANDGTGKKATVKVKVS